MPNPDGLNDESQDFNFTRSGVRVPFVVVSPWIKKGTVVHAAEAGGGQYEHSSIASTVIHKILKPAKKFMKPNYLTKRDEWAKSFEWLFDTHISDDNSNTPRVDCPMTLPDVPSHRTVYPNSLPVLNGNNTLTEFQKNLVIMMAATIEDTSFEYEELSKWTEAEASVYVTAKMKQFMNVESDINANANVDTTDTDMEYTSETESTF